MKKKSISKNLVHAYQTRKQPSGKRGAALRKSGIKYEKQEVSIAILTSNKGEEIKTARRLIDKLCSQYGYSRKKGKDNFEPFYQQGLTAEQHHLLNQLDQEYQEKSVKEICAERGVEFSNKVQKLFTQSFPNKRKHEQII